MLNNGKYWKYLNPKKLTKKQAKLAKSFLSRFRLKPISTLITFSIVLSTVFTLPLNKRVSFKFKSASQSIRW